MDELILKMGDCERRVLVSIELHESESSVGLHADLNDIAVPLE